jgi:hypothetical protein
LLNCDRIWEDGDDVTGSLRVRNFWRAEGFYKKSLVLLACFCFAEARAPHTQPPRTDFRSMYGDILYYDDDEDVF